MVDYWHLLRLHRVILLTSTIVGLFAAILISLLQTTTYRARTSLEIQGTNFSDFKGSNSNGSSDSYTTPEMYVETQVKLLQSESLLGHVIEKLNLWMQPSSDLCSGTTAGPDIGIWALEARRSIVGSRRFYGLSQETISNQSWRRDRSP